MRLPCEMRACHSCQLLAALARIEKMAKEGEEDGRERINQPGSSPWECLDYGRWRDVRHENEHISFAHGKVTPLPSLWVA